MPTITISGGTVSVTVPARPDYVVEGSGVLEVFDSGLTSGTITISSGGMVEVSAGGILRHTTVLSGGSDTVDSAGTASNTTISNGGKDIVGFLLAGYVSSPGIAIDADVESGGKQVVIGGGLTENTIVNGGGLQVVEDGGAAFGTVINGSNAAQTINVEGSATATVISSGVQSVLGIGYALSTLIDSGSTQVVYGAASETDINNGGLQLVYSGPGGNSSDGAVHDSLVSSGGEQYIGSGATSIATQVEGGGVEVVYGADSGTSISGTQYDFSTASGGTTDNGGYQLVASGATAIGMIVGVSGQQYVGSGGTTLGAQVEAGGAEVVFGSDSGASLSGTQYLYGTATGGATYSGGFQLVASGATASGMAIAFGGEQYVGSGGTTLGAQVEAGGAEVVNGVDSGAGVNGTQYDYGTASGGTTYSGGEQLVAPGATAIGMTVLSGGQQYIGTGGTALATDIAAQGAEVIFGTDSGALVSGTQYVFGVASGGTTLDGGSQQVEFGGTASGMTVSGLGLQNVGGGGTAIGTQIMSQGAETVHGTDLGASITGTQYVLGLASGTVVGTGGYQLVSTGGTISAAGINGGTIELMSGASNGTAPITFSSAGQLILDASTSFSGTVAGFGKASLNDTIDFADIPYVAAGSAGATTIAWSQLTSGGNASGTLMVSQGGHTADITLLGQYAAGNFTASSDGQGGTLITDPPVAMATDSNPTPQLAAHHA